MKSVYAYSIKNTEELVVKDLQTKIGNTSAKLLIYFASTRYNTQKIAELMHHAFPGVHTIGCTTAGELISGMMMKDSVVALCLDDETIEDFEVAVLKDIDKNMDLSPAVESFEQKFKTNFSNLEFDKYFGLVLVDGLSGKEEQLMDEIGNYTDILFVGGSAGDDLKFKATSVCNKNEIFSNSALLVLIKPKKKFGFIKTQSFNILDKTLIPTKVNEEKREVVEFNNEPASEYYARLVGSEVNAIESSFMKNPVGLIINDDPYVRSPRAAEGTSIKFYCNVKEGVELNLLESTNIIDDTKNAINDYIRANGKISAIINFNCILRTLQLENEGLCEQYGRLFSDIPTIGFSTYGEEYIGHMNQTATMLVIH